MGTAIKSMISTRENLECARAAAPRVAELSTEQKNNLLLAMAEAIAANENDIVAENRKDMESSGTEGAMRDRLLLTPQRVAAMAAGVREIAALPDPVGEIIS